MKYLLCLLLFVKSDLLKAQKLYLAQSTDYNIYLLRDDSIIKKVPCASKKDLVAYELRHDTITIWMKDEMGNLLVCKEAPDRNTKYKTNNILPFKKEYMHFTSVMKPIMGVTNFTEFKSDSTTEADTKYRIAHTYDIGDSIKLAIDYYGCIHIIQQAKLVWCSCTYIDILSFGLTLREDMLNSARMYGAHLIFIDKIGFSERKSRLIAINMLKGKHKKVIARGNRICNAFYSDDGEHIYFTMRHRNKDYVYRYNLKSKRHSRKYIRVNHKKVYLSKMFEVNENDKGN